MVNKLIIRSVLNLNFSFKTHQFPTSLYRALRRGLPERRVAIWTVGCGKYGIHVACIGWITFNTICWPIKSTHKYLCGDFKFEKIFRNRKIRPKLYPCQFPLAHKKRKQRKPLHLDSTSIFIMFIVSEASFYFNILSCRQHAIVITCLTA